MRIQMEKSVFESLATDAVGHACFVPMVPIYQAGMQGLNGKEVAEYRAEFYGTLTPGQRALFMFFTYYDHAIQSPDEFERISYHYWSAKILGAVKKGMEYFHDNEMLDLLSKIEQVISDNRQSELSELYQRLREISPNTLSAVGAFVKENPAEFVSLDYAIYGDRHHAEYQSN